MKTPSPMIKFRLEDIGRTNYNGEVTVSDETGLLREVKKHLKSRYVQLETVDGGRTYAVIAGLYRVGTCHKILDQPAEVISLLQYVHPMETR